MSRFGRFPQILAVTCCLILFMYVAVHSETKDPPVPGEVIVKLKEPIEGLRAGQKLTGLKSFDAIGRKYDLIATRRIAKLRPEKVPIFPNISRIYLLKFRADANTKFIAKEYERDPHVEYVHLNVYGRVDRTPDDPHFPQQWGLSKIQAPRAWDYVLDTPNIHLGILDSGVDWEHPELSGMWWPNKGEEGLEYNGIDDDNNGYIDDFWGWDFVHDNNDPRPDWGQHEGHGTCVAGIASGKTNNAEGVAAIAGGWRPDFTGSKYLMLQVGDAQGIPVSAVIEAITYAINYMTDYNPRGCEILNMSFGYYEHHPALADAIYEAIWEHNRVIVASSGNDGFPNPKYPAAYGDVIGVGATNQSDKRPWWSNYGNIDVVAPGVNILTTDMRGSRGYGSGDYYNFGYTSSAAPCVSAEAAYILSINPDMGQWDVTRVIRYTADDLGDPGPDMYYGWGRVNLHRAVMLFYLAPPQLCVPEEICDVDPNGYAHLGWNWDPSPFDLEYYELYRYVVGGNDILLYEGTETEYVTEDPIPPAGWEFYVNGYTDVSVMWPIPVGYESNHVTLENKACPFVYTWDGGSFVQDNNILQNSQLADSGTDVTDNYILEKPPVHAVGGLNLKVKEFESEHSFLDQVRLQAVEHPIGTETALTSQGEVIVYEALMTPVECTDNLGNDCLDLVSSVGGGFFEANAGEWLDVNFGVVQPEWVYLGADVSYKSLSSIAVQVNDAQSGWIDIDTLHPRENWSTQLVDLTSWVSAETLRVRLKWTDYHKCDYVFLCSPVDLHIPILDCQLVSAAHSEVGDATSSLLFVDQQYAGLSPGQEIDFIFEGPGMPPGGGYERDFILISTGHYITGYESHGQQTSGQHSLVANGYVLRSVKPNPFPEETRILYFVNRPTHVAIKMFDIAGRLVKTLVDALSTAGEHSVLWDGTDALGKRVPAGVYFCRMDTGSSSSVGKVVVLR